METVYVSMDFETTGLDPDRHGPISVAFVNSEFQIYSEMNPRAVQFDPRALEVNGFDFHQIRNFRPVEEIDVYLYRQLEYNKTKYDVNKDVKYEAVGLNAGNFDMQFLRKFLPNTYSLFGHRPVDLNSISMGQWGTRDYKARLKSILDTIRINAGYNESDLHDALVDAEICWRYFVDQVLSILPPDEDDVPF